MLSNLCLFFIMRKILSIFGPMKQKFYIFDTTLRDGEQVPGCQLNTIEKIELAKMLEDMKVIAKLIAMTLKDFDNKKEEVEARVAALCAKYPLYAD